MAKGTPNVAPGKIVLEGNRVKRQWEVNIANSGPVQSFVKKQAGYIQGNANAAYGQNVFKVSPAEGKFAKGYFVSCPLLHPQSSRTEKWCEKQNSKRIEALAGASGEGA